MLQCPLGQSCFKFFQAQTLSQPLVKERFIVGRMLSNMPLGIDQVQGMGGFTPDQLSLSVCMKPP